MLLVCFDQFSQICWVRSLLVGMENNEKGTPIRTFRDLKIWQRARELAKIVYEMTRRSEFSKDFSLKDQAQSSVTSIMFNISEGFERDGNREFHNFLSVAKGSCGEIESVLVVAFDQSYIGRDEYQITIGSIREESRMIGGLMQHLKRSGLRGRKFQIPNP